MKIISKITILILLLPIALFGGIEEDCLSGDLNGCYKAGKAYLYGTGGFTKDKKIGKDYLKLACEENFQKACDELGKKSHKKEEKHKQINTQTDKARCLQGDMAGCYWVGKSYLNIYNKLKWNPKLAKEFLELACEGEYYRSCGELVGMYRDFTKAKKYAKIACEHKIGTGCDGLRMLYAEGKGVDKNEKLSKEYLLKAMQYYRQSCEQKIDNNLCKNRVCEAIGFDCSMMAWHYAHNKKIKTDYKKAIYYYKKGCELQDAESCNSVGYYYQYGKHVKRNLKVAAKYYDKACSLKSASSCFTLGMWYQFGEKGIIKEDLKKAKEYYQKSCEFGNENACESVRKITSQSVCGDKSIESCLKIGVDYYYGTNVKKNYKRAKEIFEYLCKQDNKGACFGLGNVYLRGRGASKNHKKALKYFKKSCDLGYGDACSNTAWVYMHGQRVKHKIKKAIGYQKRGCYELKSGLSCFNLANSYLKGRGVRRSRKKAYELYKKSCNLGYEDACKIR